MGKSPSVLSHEIILQALKGAYIQVGKKEILPVKRNCKKQNLFLQASWWDRSSSFISAGFWDTDTCKG